MVEWYNCINRLILQRRIWFDSFSRYLSSLDIFTSFISFFFFFFLIFLILHSISTTLHNFRFNLYSDCITLLSLIRSSDVNNISVYKFQTAGVSEKFDTRSIGARVPRQLCFLTNRISGSRHRQIGFYFSRVHRPEEKHVHTRKRSNSLQSTKCEVYSLLITGKG